MSMGIAILSGALVVLGLLFYLGGSVGIVRFPDFYARMHAAGKGDTLSSMLVLTGIAVYQLHDAGADEFKFWLTLVVIVKLLGISLFIMVTSPTSTHALMDAGYEDGQLPHTKPGGDAFQERVKAQTGASGNTNEGRSAES